jgi:hypothetical protein
MTKSPDVPVEVLMEWDRPSDESASAATGPAAILKAAVRQAFAHGAVFRLASGVVKQIDWWNAAAGLVLRPRMVDENAPARSSFYPGALRFAAWAELLAVAGGPGHRDADASTAPATVPDPNAFIDSVVSNTADATGILVLSERGQRYRAIARWDDVAGSRWAAGGPGDPLLLVAGNLGQLGAEFIAALGD